MLLTLVLFLLTLMYGCWRLWRLRQATERFAPSLPPENRLSWRLQSPTASGAIERFSVQIIGHVELEESSPFQARGKSGSDYRSETLNSLRLPAWAAATDGLLQSLPAFEAFSHVDADVLKAIDFSTAEHIKNLASVDSYINSHFFDQPIPSAEGWLHRLEGYVAEQKAAAALEQAGHHVEFAHLPNQAGWDLLVDGHPWQVKEGVSAAAQIKEFLAQHDGIEVVTSPDVASQIGDSNVHAIPDLDHDLIASSTKDSLHGIKDGFHAGLHFPIVTFLRSSYREFTLLYQQKTEVQKVLKHIAVDVAAVGGAGFVGLKTGALIGSFLGPIGAAIGGTIGGIAGAVAGKMGANALRFASFDQAKAEYFSTVETAQGAIQDRIESSQNEIRQLRRQYESQYENERSGIIRQVQEQLAAIQSKFGREVESFTKTFSTRLDQLEAQLCAEQREVLGAIPSSRLGLILPNQFDLLRSVIKRWFRKARAKVRSEKKHYLALEDRSTDNLMVEIRRFFREYEFELTALATDIQTVVDSLERTRNEADGLQSSAVEETIRIRSRLIKEFAGRVEGIYQDIGHVIRQWQQSTQRCKDALLREAKPVGMDEKLRPMLE
jgi:hypothetical protein